MRHELQVLVDLRVPRMIDQTGQLVEANINPKELLIQLLGFRDNCLGFREFRVWGLGFGV